MSEKHPHVRGEDSSQNLSVRRRLETPPRAWGRRKRVSNAAHLVRNTPTCVGKTYRPQRRERRREKHPHVRGEDSHSFPSSPAVSETPPRAWGRRNPGRSGRRRRGNTPTCVGKTEQGGVLNRGCWKHPHVRGEDIYARSSAGTVVETPPRAWGRLRRQSSCRHHMRNTPTCVGKTRRASSSLPHKRKHPHVRGEDSCTRLRVSVTLETPPRAWGRRNISETACISLRNTPTCVGKTPR